MDVFIGTRPRRNESSNALVSVCLCLSLPSFFQRQRSCRPVAPPGFCNRGGVRYGSIGGLEYEVPQKLTHLLQCTHIVHNFWTSIHRGEASPFPPSGGATAVITQQHCRDAASTQNKQLCHRRRMARLAMNVVNCTTVEPS